MGGYIDEMGYGGAMEARRHPKTGQYMLDKRFGKKVTPDEWSSTQSIASTVMQREMMRDAGKLGINAEQRSLARYGWRPGDIRGQQVKFGKGQQDIMSYQSVNDFSRRQAQPFYELTGEGRKAHAGMLNFANDYARQVGMRRMQYGAVGMYAGYKGAFYGGTQGYSANPMMAQMNSSSFQSGGGQDLYISNAYVESNNFQDLFYSSNELGG